MSARSLEQLASDSAVFRVGIKGWEGRGCASRRSLADEAAKQATCLKNVGEMTEQNICMGWERQFEKAILPANVR